MKALVIDGPSCGYTEADEARVISAVDMALEDHEGVVLLRSFQEPPNTIMGLVTSLCEESGEWPRVIMSDPYDMLTFLESMKYRAMSGLVFWDGSFNVDFAMDKYLRYGLDLSVVPVSGGR